MAPLNQRTSIFSAMTKSLEIHEDKKMWGKVGFASTGIFAIVKIKS
jgi:hypothetical protein